MVSGGTELQTQLEQLVLGSLQPGAVFGVQQGEQLELFAAGFMEREHERPMRPDAIFRISSMSKPIVALALLQLVEDGVVQLDDPVARWLPELAQPNVLLRIDAPLDDIVPAETPITVKHLLSSRMGTGILPMPPDRTPIQREIARLGLPGFGPDNPAQPLDQDEWLEQLGQLPLMAEPGARWFYNTSTYVQGVLVSRIARRPLSEQLAERIFGPLGMSDTGFFVPVGKLGRLTAAYDADLKLIDHPVNSAWSQPPRFEASLLSTAADYAAFVRCLHQRGTHSGGRLLGEELVKLMVSDHLTAEQREGGKAFLDGRGWGYGLSVDARRGADYAFTGEIGWAGGLGTSWTSHLDSDSAVFILGCRAIDHPEVMAAHVDLTKTALG
jgi:CubicO group peptidase (beta-lactamase class C family)